MKNRAKKVIAIGLGVCVFALWFVFLFFATKPYTEKVIIWLPDNHKLENTVSNEVVSIMLNFDDGRRPNSVFYSMTDLDSLKELAGKSEKVSVRIDASYPGEEKYRIVYQIKYHIDNNNKILIVAAQKYYKYDRRTLSEMRIRDKELFLKNKRDTSVMYPLLIPGFIGTAVVVFVYMLSLNISSKQSNI